MSYTQTYLDNYKKEFESHHSMVRKNNHIRRNADPEYWEILLDPIKSNPEKWENKVAFDFGCGGGRNLKNLLDLANWKEVHGCDISKPNAEFAEEWVNSIYPNKAKAWESNGKDIQPANPNTYDFIMSSVVLQHISNYSVRFNILNDMYSSLKEGGQISLHYLDMSESAPYYDNSLDYKNCRVENKDYLIDDFQKIGFKQITCEIGIDYFTKERSYYIKATK